MSEKKTLGGDRLGSGKGMKFQLPNFERSTHDLSKTWRSSMTVGTLVPTFCELGLNGDTFSFDTEALIRTIPTNAPLLGTFKFQLDFFTIPMRLYNGLTHSNAINIGLDISKVVFPKMELTSNCLNPDKYNENINTSQLSSSCLHNYLGLKGIGMYDFQDDTEEKTTVYKKFQCIPHLGYYDIYKNYYANKQEDVGKIVSAEITSKPVILERAYRNYSGSIGVQWGYGLEESTPAGVTVPTGYAFNRIVNHTNSTGDSPYNLMLGATQTNAVQLEFDGPVDITKIRLFSRINPSDNYTEIPNTRWKAILMDEINYVYIYSMAEGKIRFNAVMYEKHSNETATPEILTFPLENIDKMKFAILKNVGLGNEFIVNNENLEPYNTLHTQTNQGFQKSKYPLVGLAIKTYQSDIFNNLMSTTTINQVKAATNVAVTNGQFSLDSLFLANKTMKMLTAIAVAGGTYQDWQHAVYGDAPKTYEIPMYCGSMSAEIGFDEVVSAAAAKNATGQNQPLGTLAGKGKMISKKGGNIEIKVNEPCFVMAIASLTPRIDYSQGNKFYYLDDFSTFDDLHKPQMDGISYQDVPCETMAWWSRMKLTETGVYKNYSAGKTPAWMFYMTNYNEVHGDFMAGETLNLMVLNRNYEFNRNIDGYARGASPINDLTTYIDPTKYNYAFSDGKITAQNFWVQIAHRCELRRKISAKVIPTM